MRLTGRQWHLDSILLADLPPPLFLCALYSGSCSGLAFLKSTLSRGSKMSKLLTSSLFMFSTKKAPKKASAFCRSF